MALAGDALRRVRWQVLRRPAGDVHIRLQASGEWRTADIVEIDAALRLLAADAAAGPPTSAGLGAYDRLYSRRGTPRRKAAGWNRGPQRVAGRSLDAAARDAEIRRQRGAGASVRDIAAALRCGVGTVTRALRPGAKGKEEER